MDTFEMISKYIDLLSSATDDNNQALLNKLDEIGFYHTPCSGGNHLACESGLLEHSLNVCNLAMTTAAAVGYENINSVIIVSLLHDIGKCGDHGKPNYVPNVLKTKNKDGSCKVSESKPFRTNTDLAYIPHEVRALAIIRECFALTEEEEHAIYYHNGKYTHTGYDLKETPLQMILHFADLYASREIEKTTGESENE